MAALGGVAAIGGVGSMSEQVQANVATGIVQDSMAGQKGTTNFGNAYVGNSMNTLAAADPSFAAVSNAVSGVTAKTATGTNAGTASGTSNGTISDDVKAKAKKCATEYTGPDDNPQTDSYCKLAAFDACLHRATKLTTYDQEGRTACTTLKGLLESTGTAAYQCSYCPYPY